MQSPSYSSFYVKMRQAYAAAGPQRRPEAMRPPTPAEMTTTPSPACRAPAAEGRYDAGAIAGIERKLAAVRGQSGTPLYRCSNDQRDEQERLRRQGGEQQRQRGASSASPPVVYSGHDGDPATKGLCATVEQEVELVTPVLSPPSSRSPNENGPPTNQPSLSLPSAVPARKEPDDDDRLTPQEMSILRVVEFAVPVVVHAQLEPGASLVEVCEEATVKLFPSHLVLIRPDGVAAVELVIGELYELNEDEGASALDCIVQARGTTRRQLIRLTCTDAIARGALFKLLCARRTQLEEGAEWLEKNTSGAVSRG
ncbi:putative antigenic protein [Trypanosoma conorhini]|uniref:Putative antigenic protein n=1 Tax=Trypanosoma conorhini TaxID=83891 RepID=A0A3R7M7I7_9TRYP|nr:putative antigenic protein [Trypanosoma conorhini]RNF00898.1 putative antigenic protein [Trypanosoma conorhini]